MKKIVCAALCAAFLASGFSLPALAEEPVAAAETISSRLISGMGVIDGNYDYEKKVTRAEFVDLVIRTTDTGHFTSKIPYTDVDAKSEYYDSISAAYNIGIIAESEFFRPDDEITVGEASVILSALLGYKQYVESAGGTIAGYMQKASDCGILDGVSKGAQDKISGAAALVLLTNTLEAKVVAQQAGNSFEITDVSYMSEYLDIFKSKGIVTADGAMDFDSDIPGDGKVKIDGVEYDYDGIMSGAIGKYVEFYYKEHDDGTLELLAYEEKNRNIVYTFLSSQISSDTTSSNLVTGDSNGRKKSYSIPLDVKVLYNGASKFGYTAADLRPQVGSVTLISNDGDNKTDVIIINDYMVAAAASANADAETISFKYYDLRDRSQPKKIDLKSYERYTIIKNGEKIGLGDIKEWDVLHIAENAAKTAVTIVVCDRTVSGEVKSIEIDDNDTFWIIDGIEYGVSAGYCDTDATVKIGTKGMFYLDIEGKIVFTDTSTTQKSNYMILLKVGYDDEIEKAFVRVFTRNNTTQLIYCADKIKIKGYIAAEGGLAERSYKEAADIPAVIENTYSNVLYNPVLVEVDEAGELKKLTVPYDKSSINGYKGYDNDNFTLDKYAVSQGFMYSWANGCYFPGTTPIFIIPRPADTTAVNKKTEIMQDPDNYTATTFDAEIGRDTTEETRSYAKIYDVDKFNTPSLMTFEEEYTVVEDSSASETTAYNEFMVVTKNTITLDDDDVARRKICGYYKGSYAEYWVKDETVVNVSGVDVGTTGTNHACLPNNATERMFGFTGGTKKFTIWGNTGKSVSKIKVGDVIQPNFNMKGEIDSFRTLYSRELDGTEVRYNAAGTAIGKGEDDDLVYVYPGEYYELSENPNLDRDAGRAVLYTAYGEIVAASGTSFRYKTRYRTLNGNSLDTYDVERVRVVNRNVYILEDGKVKEGSADDLRVGDKVFVHVRDYTCNYVYIIRD